jgi:hypothetical protein
LKRSIAIALCILAAATWLTAAHAACPYQAQSNTMNVDDGCAAAPADGFRNPNLLAKYGRNRPPWNVAGVDYPVGIPATRKLRDWQTLGSVRGIDLYDNYVRCDGRGAAHPSSRPVVLDGVDFTMHGGTYVYVPTGGCTGLTIRNSLFGASPNWNGCTANPYYAIQDQNTGMPLTVERNTFNMKNCPVGQAAMIYADGWTKVTYNYFGHIQGQVLQAPAGAYDIDYRFNYIEDCCYTHNHMNFQEFGTTANAKTDRVEFNTTYLYENLLGFGEEFQFYGNQGGTLQSAVLANNTIIALDTGGCQAHQEGCLVSYAIHGSVGSKPPTMLGSQPFDHDNYFDPSGMYGPYYPGSVNGWSNQGNIDMVTGKIIKPAR